MSPDTDFLEVAGSVHQILAYYGVLLDVARTFDTRDGQRWFDGAAFFLRGGYAIWAFLNETTGLALRGTIFGGANAARSPKEEWPKWVAELRDAALDRGLEKVDIFIADEVKSGTGLGTILNLVRDELGTWDGRPTTVNVFFVGIGPADWGGAPRDQWDVSSH
jgi:hypothetical protein